MPSRRRIQILFVALFLILLGGIGLDSIVERGRDHAVRTIDKTIIPARDELGALLTSLVDQETGQRGFLLTGNEQFLAPYTKGRASSEASLRELGTILAGDPDGLAGVDRIRSRVSAWQQLGADFEIDVKRSHRDEIVSELVSSGTGRRLFDEIRAEIADVRTQLDARLVHQQEHVNELHNRLTLVRIGNIIAALLLLAVAGRLVARWVTEPLGRLSTAVRAAASGALHDPIDSGGPPDLARLAADVDAMRRRLLSEVDDAARARAALADRGMIVVTLRDDLAPADIVLPEGVHLAGRFRPAKGLVAGDWYDMVRLDEDRVVLALVDVSGHGAEVATFALRTKALTMAAIATYSPGDALGWLASHLGDTGELFLTGTIVEVSGATGAIRYASAGHPPLLLAGITGITELAPTGPLLGPLPGSWSTEMTTLDRGGVLVAYSDGLIEARDADRDMFGVDRLGKVVAEYQLAGVNAVANAVIESLEAFAAEGGRGDDVTVCVLGR